MMRTMREHGNYLVTQHPVYTNSSHITMAL